MITEQNKHWFVFGHEQPKTQLAKVLEKGAPPWRNFADTTRHTAYEFQIDEEAEQTINAAIYLRRPLLVTGDPGTGKSSLAYAITAELGLGDVLVWPITSRSTLTDALYRYDAIGRLQEANLGQRLHPQSEPKPEPQSEERQAKPIPPIEKYLTLGPLGTALADSSEWPRVLLIDEIDKCDIDLPNDLLHIFEEGEFEIPELSRLVDDGGDTGDNSSEHQTFAIRKYQAKEAIPVQDGVVRCHHFPIVIMTSNNEREFPAPFLRRCLHLPLKRPDEQRLADIVAAHFDYDTPYLQTFIADVMEKERKGELVATDQLMNAIHLARQIVLSHRDTNAGANAQETRLTLEEEAMVMKTVMSSIRRIYHSQ
ncbi:MAG: MoxR family ATPase [Chloroflexota bacterium]